LPPSTPFTFHVTAVFLVLETVAVNEAVWPALSVVAAGEMVTVTVLVEDPPPQLASVTRKNSNSKIEIRGSAPESTNSFLVAYTLPPRSAWDCCKQ
jgi:hypothetical protein